MKQGSSRTFTTRALYPLCLFGIIWLLSGCDFSLPYWFFGTSSNQSEYTNSRTDDFFDYSEDLFDSEGLSNNINEETVIVKVLPTTPLPVNREHLDQISELKLLTQDQRYQLSQRYTNQSFEFLSYYALDDNGLTAIILNFSSPVNPEQHFSPLISVIDLSEGKLPTLFELSEDLMSIKIKGLPAERNIIITISKDLVGVNARSLLKEQRIEESTPKAIHAVGFLSDGTILQRYSPDGLPILSSNVKSIDLNFYKIDVDKLPDFYLNWKNNGVLALEVLNQKFQQYLNGSKIHYSTKVALEEAIGYRKQFSLLVQNIPELKESGVYVVLMNETGNYSTINPAMAFMVTDIGIIVHRYTQEWQLAVQSIETGEPLANIAIELLNEEGTLLYQAYTDSDGWLTLPYISGAVLLVARNETQMSLLDLQQDYLALTEFNLGGEAYAKKQFVLLDPVYHSKKSLTLSGLLRSDKGTRLENQSIGLELYDSDNKLQESARLDGVKGFYQYHYLLDEAMRFGIWRVVLDLGEVKQTYLLNLLEDNRDIKVTSLNSEQEITLIEQPIEYDVTLITKDGQALTDHIANVAFSVQRELLFSQYPGFLFGKTTPPSYCPNFNVASYVTNAYGEFKVSFSAKNYAELFKLPALLLTDINIAQRTETGALTRRVSHLIWPNQLIYGIRPLARVLDVSQELQLNERSIAEFEVIAINQAQQQVELPTIMAKLVREKQEYSWRWDNHLGWIQEQHTQDIYLTSRAIQNSDKFTAHVAFPIEAGNYRIELYQQQQLVNLFRFSTCCNTSNHKVSVPIQSNVVASLPLDLQRTEQGLHITITSEQVAHGTIFIESSKKMLFKQRINTVLGQNHYTIPIDDSWDNGDTYISVWLLGNQKPQGEIKRYLAIHPLPERLTKQAIRAIVDFQEELSLGKEVNLYMNLYTTLDKPKQVSALFSFIAKNTQTRQQLEVYSNYNWLFDVFLAPRRYQVKWLDIYTRLIGTHAPSKPVINPKRDGALAPKILQLHPIKEQIFLPKIVVNEMGIAKFKLTLPKEQGEFYLVGQIWSDNQYGTVLKEINLLEPYVVKVVVPEQLFLGDTTEIMVNIASQVEYKQLLTVKLTPLQTQKMDIEPLSVDINLAAQAQQQIFFPLPTLSQLGEVSMQLEVSAKQLDKTPHQQKESIKFNVESPYPKQYDSYVFNLPVGETWYLPEQELQALIPESVSFDVLLTDGVPLMMLNYLSDLTGVDKQPLLVDKISILSSWLALGDDAVKLGVVSPTDVARQQIIQRVINELVLTQLPSGGFSISALDLRESPWGTVYLADFFRKAQQKQYQVDPEVWSQLLQRVKEYTVTEFISPEVSEQYQSEARSAVNGYAALLLTQENKITEQELLAINGILSHTLSGLPMLQLGIALESLGERSQSNILITLGKNQYRNDEFINIGDFGSHLRDRALTLALLAQYQIEPTLLAHLGLTLSRQVLLQQRLSESEKTALFFAAREFMDTQQQEWQVELNDNALISNRSWQYRFSGEQSTQRGLMMTNRGVIPLQVRISLSGYPKQQPYLADDSLIIEQQFYNLDGALIEPTSLRVGDKIAVLVKISSKGKLKDLLFEDSFSAGLSLDRHSSEYHKSVANFLQRRPEMRKILEQAAQTEITKLPSLNNSYRALLNVDAHQPAILFFIARATYSGEYIFAMPTVYSLSKPQHYAVGKTPQKLMIKKALLQ